MTVSSFHIISWHENVYYTMSPTVLGHTRFYHKVWLMETYDTILVEQLLRFLNYKLQKIPPHTAMSV